MKFGGIDFYSEMICMIHKEITKAYYSCWICHQLHWKVHDFSILGIFFFFLGGGEINHF